MTAEHFAHLLFLCYYDEQWRTVPDWPAYKVSNWGRVMSFWKRQGTRENLKMVIGDKGRLLKPQFVPRCKHWHVTLCDAANKSQATYMLGRLVLMAFDRMPNEGEVARHVYSPDTSINHRWNLAWGYPSDNAIDRVKHGNNHYAKLTESDVRDIKLMLRDGVRQQEIADRYRIHNANVSMIKNGLRWAHVQIDDLKHARSPEPISMAYSVFLTESENIVSTIQTKNGTGSYYGDAINLSQESGRRFEADINVGAIGASATVDFEFQWSATSGGTYATITGTAITQDTTGGKTHRVEVSTEQIVQAYPTARYMKPYLKTLVAATPTGVVVRSSDSAHQPITNSAANVGQVINGKA